MARQMRPRHIVVAVAAPLTAVFGKAEAEQAAALLLVGMQAADTWDPVTPKTIADHIRKLNSEGKRITWATNPFFRPDIDRLIAGGFAEWVGDETEGRKRPVRFTAAGLKALRLSRWNTCTVTVCSDCFRAACWQGKHYCEGYVGAFCVEKTPWELLALRKSGEAQPEDPSYWDICDECGTACEGRCSAKLPSSKAVVRANQKMLKQQADKEQGNG